MKISISIFFSQSLGTKSHKCSSELFKSLIEQKYSIMIDSKQLDSLIAFMNQSDEQKNSNGQITWIELFKKFAELEYVYM